jgi:hypothetical protein
VNFKAKYLILGLILTVFSVPNAYSSSTFDQGKINRNYQKLSLLQNEIKILREYLGISQMSFSEFPVSNVSPREVYFLALTLFKKTNKLSFEQILRRTPSTKLLSSVPDEDDIFQLIQDTLKTISNIKNSLKIEESATQDDYMNKTPTDIFKRLIFLSHEINSMLDYKTTPTDVYQKVDDAIFLTKNILQKKRE